MKKHSFVIFLIMILTALTFSLSFAWFTHTQSKQVIQLTSNEIQITTYANEQIILDQFSINDLAMIDFDHDFVLNKYNVLKDLATIFKVTVKLSDSSPTSRQRISIESNDQNLLYIIYFNGMNNNLNLINLSEIDQIVQEIVFNHTTYELTSNEISLYNQSVIDAMNEMTMQPGDTMTFQIIIWGLENAKDVFDLYFKLIIESTSYVGGS